MEKDYNTQREPILHKEYGRNIKMLTAFIGNIEDPEERTKYAHTLVKLMKQIVPNTVMAETNQKYWDDIQIVSGFNLDVEGPYPIPEKETLTRKPEKVPYHNNKIKMKHYGRNVELLINKAIELKDPEEMEVAVIYIGKLMKTFHLSWSKDNVDDKVIIKNIEKLSEGKLTIDLEKVVENNLFEILYKSKSKPRNTNTKRSNHKNQGRNQNKNGGRNQNRRRRS